jgi:uncharacterized protein YyaL (SSP411 family)
MHNHGSSETKIAATHPRHAMSDSAPSHPNALIHESSPYLLQHAYNPVDWKPWSEEVWEEAQAQDKLVIVSIGYSACHWCHVMEHETFEDSAAAAFMNEHFVCIKVDREERPDVDGVYMTAVQLMTQRGGWPLNAVCLPDGRPVYGGTYFPRERWVQALQSVLDTRNQNPERVEEYAAQLTAGVAAAELVEVPPLEGSQAWGTPDAFGPAHGALLDDGIDRWKQNWDSKWGGNDRAPKFPIPTNLDFLLHYRTVREDQQALDHVLNTLLKMERGGIHDQVGGGFARYSVDEKWHVPHFEKMLYDNAQLAGTYARAWQSFPDADAADRAALKRAAIGTIAFVKREWSHSSGGFYSALDADSEGVEGQFYVWTSDELETLLTPDEFQVAKTVYAIDGASAWAEEIPNANVIMRWKSDEALAEITQTSVELLHNRLTEIQEKLRAARTKRVPPGTDDKILTAWTALMASGLISTGIAFDRPDDVERARIALDFILETQRADDGRLRHAFHEKTGPRIDAFLDDYAFTIGACLDLYQATFDHRYAQAASELCETALADFYDENQGTFWFTATNGESLFARKQENDDNVIPSANAQMARNLFQLSALFSKRDHRIIADRMLAGAIERTDYWPSATHWAELLLWRTESFKEVVIAGTSKKQVDSLRSELQRHYLPNVIYAGGVEEKLPLLEGRVMDEALIFVCQEGACGLPVKKASEAIDLLK